MDQLKLLNFHKMLSNFATNIVGAFVALIIMQATGDILFGFLYLSALCIIRLIFTCMFKKRYGKYPQLFLLLRILPFTLYNLFIFLIDFNLIFAVIGICIFHALDSSLNYLSREIIYNYSSLTNKTQKSSTIGVTRLFEQAGTIIAMLLGGYLLDINKAIVLIISLSIYGISVVPLVMFYVKCRKQKTFNKDATSNAVTTLKNKNDELKMECKKLTKKLLLAYFIVYFSFSYIDILQNSYSLYIFSIKGEFSTAGILNAIFNLAYAIGFYLAGLINEKKDTTKLVASLCAIISVVSLGLPFIPIDTMFILVCISYGIIAFGLPFISLFVLDRMLLKSRIMGCSNKALFIRETGCLASYCFGYSIGMIGVIPAFISIAIVMLSASFIVPCAEEKTRQHLVDYLQNNEKINKASKNKSK